MHTEFIDCVLLNFSPKLGSSIISQYLKTIITFSSRFCFLPSLGLGGDHLYAWQCLTLLQKKDNYLNILHNMQISINNCKIANITGTYIRFYIMCTKGRELELNRLNRFKLDKICHHFMIIAGTLGVFFFSALVHSVSKSAFRFCLRVC